LTSENEIKLDCSKLMLGGSRRDRWGTIGEGSKPPWLRACPPPPSLCTGKSMTNRNGWTGLIHSYILPIPFLSFTRWWKSPKFGLDFQPRSALSRSA